VFGQVDLPHRASAKQSHDGVPGKHGTLGQRHAGNGSHAVAGVAILSAVSPTLGRRRPAPLGAVDQAINDLLAGAKTVAPGPRHQVLYRFIPVCSKLL
jgi:hypothetical protein